MRRLEILATAALSVALVIVAVMGCRSSAALPSRPLSQLRSAPTTVTVGARTLALSAELWRDFMPISPPDGKPMIATLRIATEDGTGLPPGLKADSTWVLHGEHVWETLAVEQEPRAAGASRIEILAREGPKWGPEIQVDVVVRIVDAEGRVSLLRAPNQNVARAS